VSAGPRLPHFALVKLLAEAASLEHATPRFIELIAGAFGWSAGALWLADAEDRVLVWSDGWTEAGDVAEFAARSRRLTFPRGIGLPGRVWADGEPAWVADVAADANLPRADLAGALGLRAAAAIPVYGDEGALGALEFLGREPREPDAEALEAMRTAGRQLGQYLERRRAERRLRDAEAHAASIVRGALDCIVLMDATGVIRDFNVIYRLGSSTERLDGGFGPTAGVGYYRRSNDTFAWDVQLFVALTNYTAGTQEISANTFGLTVGVHLNNE